jgi:hypothetical protein
VRLRTMRALSTNVAVLVTAVLALLLIAYVITGSSSDERETAPHCTSRQALDQIKNELFRRAAVVRGTNDAGFAAVANYSVVRAGSPLYRTHHRGSAKVTCAGSITLDLPPGVAIVGGRRSLTANIQYDLEPSAGGAARLIMLSKADDVVAPLATVSAAPRQAGSLLPAPTPDPAQVTAVAQPQPVQRAEPHAAPQPHERQSAPTKGGLPTSVPSPKDASAVPHAKMAPTASVLPSAPSRTGAARMKPSFNCAHARTRGEIAVCRDGTLAALDREMSHQFYRALAAARPDQRAMLQRSRNRFLAYRDSCRSDACIADTYRGRMREINDIMAGIW